MDRFYIKGDKMYQKLDSMLNYNHDSFLFPNTTLENLMYNNINVIWNISNVPKELAQIIPFTQNSNIMIYHGENSSDLPISITNLGKRYETYKFKNGVEIFVAYLI